MTSSADPLPVRRATHPLLPVALVAFCLVGTSCNSGNAAAQPTPPAVPVSVITVRPEDVPIYTEFAAETFARNLVEVRARVDGFVEKRLFEIGSDVKQGDILFQLDLQPYQAALEKAQGDLEQSQANLEFATRQVALLQAQANLAQSQASLLKARQDVERLQPLVKEEAAAQQDLDNARVALTAAQANVGTPN